MKVRKVLKLVEDDNNEQPEEVVQKEPELQQKEEPEVKQEEQPEVQNTENNEDDNYDPFADVPEEMFAGIDDAWNELQNPVISAAHDWSNRWTDEAAELDRLAEKETNEMKQKLYRICKTAEEKKGQNPSGKTSFPSNPCFTSLPGTGKTSIVEAWCNDVGYHYVEWKLSGFSRTTLGSILKPEVLDKDGKLVTDFNKDTSDTNDMQKEADETAVVMEEKPVQQNESLTEDANSKSYTQSFRIDPKTQKLVAVEYASSKFDELESPDGRPVILMLDEVNGCDVLNVYFLLYSLVLNHYVNVSSPDGKGSGRRFFKDLALVVAAMNPISEKEIGIRAMDTTMPHAFMERFQQINWDATRTDSLEYLPKEYETVANKWIKDGQYELARIKHNYYNTVDDKKKARSRMDRYLSYANTESCRGALAACILSDERFKFTSMADYYDNGGLLDIDHDQVGDGPDKVWNKRITEPRTLNTTLDMCDGSSNSVISIWNDYNNSQDLPLIKKILQNFVSPETLALKMQKQGANKIMSNSGKQAFNSMFKDYVNVEPIQSRAIHKDGTDRTDKSTNTGSANLNNSQEVK